MSSKSGSELLKIAETHLGEKYQFTHVPKNNPNWRGPWDCAELASWCVYQLVGKLYGCLDNSLNPDHADAYSGAWARECINGSLLITDQAEALTTPGIILIRKPPFGKSLGHIAISNGCGGTVEAAGVNLGVRKGKVSGRPWDFYAKIPELSYQASSAPPKVARPPFILRLTEPATTGLLVKKIQQALKRAGYTPGPIDGVLGLQTISAVCVFQADHKLVADGMIGPLTAKKLGVAWK